MKTFSKEPSARERLQPILCPVCGSEVFSDRWSTSGSRWVSCRSCALIMQNPQPVTEDIITRYDDSYFNYERENEEPFLNLMKLGLRDIGFDRLGVNEQDSNTFLDIGCATGRLAAYLKDRGWQAEGVEVCRSMAEFGRKELGVTIFPGTLEEAFYDDCRFDVVHNSHVIEHINRPDLFMMEIFRILKPGGYYICTTPNSLGLQALLFRENWRSAIPDHLFLFSLKTLPRMAKGAGFRVIRKKTWGGLGKGTAPDWLKKLVDPLVKPFHWGDVMIFLFQRPV